MRSEIALAADGLTKRFGDRRAVTDLSFTVRTGAITGFLGPNGAGKSTTLRLFMGLDRPTAGSALVGGRPLAQWPDPGHQVGAVLSSRCAHPGRTALDSVRWVGRLVGASEAQCRHWLERVGLCAHADRRTGEFSLGMHQRLALAQALLADPLVLVLDEPMNGLDPEGITWLRELLRQQRADGRAVFLSSHLLRELDDLVDDLVVISQGRLLSAGPADEFRDRFQRQVVLVRSPDLDRLLPVLERAGGLLRDRMARDRVRIEGLAAREIAVCARDIDALIEEISTDRGLEAAFDSATRAPKEEV